MSIILTNNSIQIDGSTVFRLTTNGFTDLYLPTSDTNGNFTWDPSRTFTAKTLDEQTSVLETYSGSGNFVVDATQRNSLVIVKANNNIFYANGVTVAPDSVAVPATLGDKTRILFLGHDFTTTTAQPIGVKGIRLPGNVNGYWIFAALSQLGNDDIDVIVNQAAQPGAWIVGYPIPQELTLLYSPIGVCKNGSRYTIGGNQCTDFVWYRTKGGPLASVTLIQTGTVPVAVVGPGGSGDPGPLGPFE